MRIDAVPIGKNPPEDINVIIEVSVGGEPIKYEMDKEAGAMYVDRFLYTPMRYPGNYGFVPHTLCGDGDPVDVIHANPLGKIPALVRDDGPALYDSRVITRYLDARAGGRLYPETRIWEVLTLEATADGIMDAALAMVLELRLRAEGERSPRWIEGQWRKVERGLDAIEDRAQTRLRRSRRGGRSVKQREDETE